MAVLSQTSGPDSRQTRETVKLPYLWPTAKELSSGSAESPELSTLMAGAKCVFLVTSDLVDSGIDQIRQSFVSNERLIVNLVVIVYPTCLTRSHHLCDLFALSENFQNRLNIKIYAKEWDWAPAVNLCVIHRSGLPPVVVTGSSGNVGKAPVTDCQLNLITEIDDNLEGKIQNWMDWLFAVSSPLTEDSTDIPFLVRPKGSLEGDQLWYQYQVSLAVSSLSRTWEKPSVDPQTGQVVVVDENGETVPTASNILGLAPVDPLASEITELLALGRIVYIDKGTRVKPLECPLSARALGIDDIQEETVTVRSIATVSVFSPDNLSQIETFRKQTSFLVEKFTFSIADGGKWMPDSARALFEAEMGRATAAGSAFLNKIVGGTAADFVRTKRDQIARNVQGVYERFRPGKTVPSSVVDQVMNSLEKRLEEALNGMLPQVLFTTMNLRLSGAEPDSPEWRSALNFVVDAGLKMRDATMGNYFWRGFTVDQKGFLEKMDVFDDTILKAAGFGQAMTESQTLKELRGGSDPAQERCRIARAIIAGK